MGVPFWFKKQGWELLTTINTATGPPDPVPIIYSPALNN